jgi:glycine/sarcosine N-methyltransferase
MPKSVQDFYSLMADRYHLIFKDWDEAMARQARVINALLSRRTAVQPLDILDCACGIGTQALGLAALGHQVAGTDLSSGAIERARIEARKRNVDAKFDVSDMTTLSHFAFNSFDVVGAFDNALPHLSEEQLVAASRSFRRVLRLGGVFLASIRNYDELIVSRPTVQGPSFFGSPGARRMIHQIWEWTSADRYDVHQFISLESDTATGWETAHFVSEYRCLLRAECESALRSAAFTDIEWIMPEESGFYQPIVMATAI